MKLGIILKDKSKIVIESEYEIKIRDDQDDLLTFLYSVYSEIEEKHLWNVKSIEKKDIQLIYFGGWND